MLKNIPDNGMPDFHSLCTNAHTAQITEIAKNRQGCRTSVLPWLHTIISNALSSKFILIHHPVEKKAPFFTAANEFHDAILKLGKNKETKVHRQFNSPMTERTCRMEESAICQIHRQRAQVWQLDTSMLRFRMPVSAFSSSESHNRNDKFQVEAISQ